MQYLSKIINKSKVAQADSYAIEMSTKIGEIINRLATPEELKYLKTAARNSTLESSTPRSLAGVLQSAIDGNQAIAKEVDRLGIPLSSLLEIAPVFLSGIHGYVPKTQQIPG